MVDFYTTREAATKLGVSITTVQIWVESGVLPAWKTAGGHRRIPCEAVDAMHASQSQTPSQTTAPESNHASSVLVVEDDPVQRELYRLKFSDWKLPLNLHLANDGFEGLIMAGKYSPDIVISDLDMPGMDGFGMIRRLVGAQMAPAPMLIVVTALSADEIQERGGLPNGIPVYSKPVPFGILKQILMQIINKRQSKLLQAAPYQ